MNIQETAPHFGVAGFPPNFFESDLRKKRENIFLWLNQLGLDWIELQCTRGVKMRDEQAHLYSKLAQEYQIGISIHGPYFISLASNDKGVVERSRTRILQCFALASELGSQRIIFHPGFFPGKTDDDRRMAVRRIVDELNALKHDVPAGVHIFPETAGKISQIGSLGEIIDICQRVDYARPCIDLAHIHAFERGSLWDVKSIVGIFSMIKDRLGAEYLNQLHVHMYPIEYNAHGEKVHRAFGDRIDISEQMSVFQPSALHDGFFPRAEDFISSIKKLDIRPIVICEAHNTQEIGATLMKKLYYDGT